MKTQKNTAVRFIEIANHLRDELLANRYGTEGRMPSEAQIVRTFGISRPTAARALRVLEEEGLLERRAGSGTFAKLDSGAGAKSRLLALLIPGLGTTEVFHLICGEIASFARMRDFGLVWGGSGRMPLTPDMSLEQTEQLCRQYIEQRVAGVFFAPHELVRGKEDANRMMAVMLREAGIPVVLLDRDLTPFPQRSDFDLVGIDNLYGGHLLGEHLLNLGCTRIHFVARPDSAPTVDARIAGVRESLSRRNINTDQNWVRIGDLGDVKFLRNLLSPPLPEAFICANDHTAAILLRELHKRHILVPEQVRVVGFDDVKCATLTSPSLTTVQQPCREVAVTAFRVMMDRLNDVTHPPCHFSLTPRLVIRNSCGTYLPRQDPGDPHAVKTSNYTV